MYVCLTAPTTDLNGKQAAPDAEDDDWAALSHSEYREQFAAV